VTARTDGHAVDVIDLVKSYPDRRTGGVNAVSGVTFTVKAGDFYTLLGPSGCGKTSTLRCIAGLEIADGGTIVAHGEVLSDARSGRFIPSEQRSMGMVFQSYAIWPHMTVFENVAFPLRVARTKVAASEIARRVGEALGAVHLAGYEGRPSTNLSGGQQQRVALARALVREPKVLLLDEPLSNLDAKLRDVLRGEIRDLQRRLGITTIYVTHDQSEALSMSDRIAVLADGRIVQEGSPREIYHAPATKFVADFVGTSNALEATVVGTGAGGRMLLETSAGRLEAVCPPQVGGGETVTLAVRPEDIRLHRTAPAGVNVLAGTVGRIVFLGDYIHCELSVGTALLATRQHPTTALRPGDAVHVELPHEFCTIFSDAHGIAASRPRAEDALS
jgi:iron(III) transport system ATP-binding protein